MMHDSAFKIGTLALNIYADLQRAAVLEIGSQSINGSLRDSIVPTTRYVGMDIEPGDGVDIVVDPGKPLPADDFSFDFVIASSVFEHDPCFWMTFLEMCRVTKEGGYIYINAPSNGVVHRYPEDNWRFYPDSGKALAKWAVSQGQHVSLVESFVAERQDDIWNDLVAVFRKGRITETLPKVFLHEQVSCSNVLTWKSNKIINQRDEPEDMVLLREATERANEIGTSLSDAVEQRDFEAAQAVQLAARLDATEAQVRQLQEEIEQTRCELAQTRSELAQTRVDRDDGLARLTASDQKLQLETALRSQAEVMVEQYRLLHEQDQLALLGLQAAQEQLSMEHAALEKKLDNMEAECSKTSSDLERERLESDRRIGELSRALNSAQDRCRAHDERWASHFDETATLSRMLLQHEQEALRKAEKLQRLREIYNALAQRPRRWAILPRSHRARMDHRRLQLLGLFDAQSYLSKNPDVAQSGMDPVLHFLNHGIDEDRPA